MNYEYRRYQGHRRNPNTHPFLFATGIENSYPTIEIRGGRKRVDEMEKTHHYTRWEEDFHLVRDLGIRYLRYGPPYYKTHQGRGKYNWSFSDVTFQKLRELQIVPIADLCHFGVPDWIGDFQNPEWPEAFAEYAAEFSRRYNWVRFYTPVNEIFICARFSAELGWWNERLSSDRSFVTAIKHLARADILAEEAILKHQGNALFIQSESTEHFHAVGPQARPRAAFLNQKRFLSLDLCYGQDVNAAMYQYLADNGMHRDEYNWFMEHGESIRPYCIMGNDYYATNEHLVPVGDAPFQPAGDIFGYYVITRQYFERYHMPVMHTETNQRGVTDAPNWLRRQWANMVQLKESGVPIIGFTWFSLTHQVDWNTALREDNGHIDPLGLCDLDRVVTPVGYAYRDLVAEWRDILPMESEGLNIQHAPDTK